MPWALEPGKIYVLDTEPSGNDPDNITSIGTEGSNHAVMDIPKKIVDIMSSKKTYYDFPGCESIGIPLNYWSDKPEIEGELAATSLSTAITRLGNWKKFVQEENTDTSLYLIICFAANVYWPFYDYSANTLRQYSEGFFRDNDLVAKYVFTERGSQVIEITLNWKSNW